MFIIGLGAGILGCFGAYEYALKLEKDVITYLVIAAPLVAIMATLIPPLAEHCWREGEHFKSIIWWSSLIPVAALIFLSAAERVHMAKANQSAEIQAKQSAVVRAYTALEEAKAELKLVEADEAKAKVTKNCGLQCQARLERVKLARDKVAVAEATLSEKQGVAVEESKWKPPAWLLPLCLDIIAFLAIWTSLSGPWIVRKQRFWRTRKLYKRLMPKNIDPVNPVTNTKRRILWNRTQLFAK
jgi:leucyl-tRNA synthetase